MKKTLTAIGLGVVLTLPVAHAALISPTVNNGSFESGTFSPNHPPDAGVVVLGPGSTDLTGWSIQPFYAGGPLGALAWIDNSNPFHLTAAAGTRFLDLSGYRDDQPYGGVATALSLNTVVGQKYQVSFQLGSDYTYDGTVTPIIHVGIASGYSPWVSGHDFTASSLTPSVVNRWEPETFVFTATDTKTALWFQGDAASSVKYIGLDDVNVTAVPEAPTLIAGALLLLPLALSSVRILRRGAI